MHHPTPAEQAEQLGIDTRGKTRGQLKTTCPKCSHERRNNRREPCLSVNLDGDAPVWRCHHCGWYGPQSGDLTAGAAPRSYGTRSEAALGRQPAKTYTKPAPPEPTAEERAVARLYGFWEARGISRATVDRYGVTTNGKGIQIPYYRDGELVNVKHRWQVKGEDGEPKKRHRMESGAELVFYNLDRCQGADQVYIVEGEPDVLALAECGVEAVLSPPNGAPSPETDITTAKLEYLPSGEAIFEGASTIVLAGDNDTPGRKLMDELARRIGREKCWRVTWPDGCKDANDTLIAHGPEAVRAALAGMTPEPVEGITRPSDYLDLIWQYRDHHEQGARVSWPRVAELARFSPGQLSIWTGVPGSGKSSLVNAVALDLARHHGWKTGLFSPEYFPPELMLADMVKTYLRKPLDRRHPNRATDDEAREAVAFIDAHFGFIMPEHPTLDAVLEAGRALVYREGITMLVIDPWTELDQTDRGGMSETDWIDGALKKIRRFGRNYNVHMAVTAHPTKMRAIDQPDGTRKMPVVQPYDISGSRHWFEMGDLMFSIYRNKEEPADPIELHVQKVRHRGNGQLGIAYLNFDIATGAYTDVSEEMDLLPNLADMDDIYGR